jgi:L,D-peptidoglycan transpeptidase YkuD (ErfK/YbiS/YcfS/YnhG family)
MFNLLIKYNHSPVIKGKGSAIFLHITKNLNKPTRGCVAITKINLLKILPLINRKTKIMIK